MPQQRRGYLSAFFALTVALCAGCGGDDASSSSSGGVTFGPIERLTGPRVDQIDLLLVIDDSRSMADKQAVLAAAIPELLQRLLNPSCVDAHRAVVATPGSPLDPCPTGTTRAFAPPRDAHLGVITSSLGAHGGDACTPAQDRAAHLSTKGPSGPVATYRSEGFLAWDPAQELSPPGTEKLGDATAAFTDLVAGAGEAGCGFESQLEAWYRFLVDPAPYASIHEDGNGRFVQSGVDDTVLQERKDFLRPGSALGIVMLTDENDCSVKEYSFYPLASTLNDQGSPFVLPRATSKCATNPSDHCCSSCGAVPSDCPADPVCNAPPDPAADPPNLRCFHQKQRFGIDFLYPIERYTIALTSPRIPDPHANGGADGTNSGGALVENPIYTNLDPNDVSLNLRDPSRVFVAGIVGVPWQDVARDPGDLTKGFKDDVELGPTSTTWHVILGEPEKFVLPTDPHMVESIAPRSGTDPVTGTKLAPPGAAAGADPINGHERTITNRDDLQYACIFDLPAPRDCSSPGAPGCDCGTPDAATNPLCDPIDPTRQLRAKAYPGIRELDLLRSLGPNGVVTSICPAQVGEAKALDYGYRPAVAAIADRMQRAFGVGCFARVLNPAGSGEVPCILLEARATHGACDASCPAPGRAAVAATDQTVADEVLADPVARALGVDCVCEIPQASGADLAACEKSGGGAGWCYVDPAQIISSNPALVAACPADEKRTIHFVGAANPSPEGTLFIACAAP